jgi:hypothetical protein
MKKIRLIIASLLLSTGVASYAQMPENPSAQKLIAVVNKANWCGVCKANGERFTSVLLPYSAKGVTIFVNDLTNETTKVASKQALEEAHVYETVNTIPRKGMGKALKACGIVKDRKQTQDAAGIVTFIDPISHKQLKQVSISLADDDMKNVIESLLNDSL